MYDEVSSSNVPPSQVQNAPPQMVYVVKPATADDVTSPFFSLAYCERQQGHEQKGEDAATTRGDQYFEQVNELADIEFVVPLALMAVCG
eukprot:6491783-Amphidinium_carterae.2